MKRRIPKTVTLSVETFFFLNSWHVSWASALALNWVCGSPRRHCWQLTTYPCNKQSITLLPRKALCTGAERKLKSTDEDNSPTCWQGDWNPSQFQTEFMLSCYDFWAKSSLFKWDTVAGCLNHAFHKSFFSWNVKLINHTYEKVPSLNSGDWFCTILLQ